MSDEVNWLTLLAAVGRCHTRLRAFAASLKGVSGMSDAVHSSNLYELPGAAGFRIEESVGVELASGDALEWGLDLSGSTSRGLRIESTISRIESAGGTVLVDVADDRFSDPIHCARALDEIVARLCVVPELKKADGIAP